MHQVEFRSGMMRLVRNDVIFATMTNKTNGGFYGTCTTKCQLQFKQISITFQRPTKKLTPYEISVKLFSSSKLDLFLKDLF